MTNQTIRVLTDFSNYVTQDPLYIFTDSETELEIQSKIPSRYHFANRIQIKLPTVQSENVKKPTKSIQLLPPKPLKPTLTSRSSLKSSTKNTAIRSPLNQSDQHTIKRHSSTPRYRQYPQTPSRLRTNLKHDDSQISIIKKVWLQVPAMPNAQSKLKEMNVPSYCYLPPTYPNVPRSASETKKFSIKDNLKFSRKDLEQSFNKKLEKYSNLMNTLDFDTSINTQLKLNRFRQE